MASGYSINPLSKKLGLKENYHVRLLNPPENYNTLVDGWENYLLDMGADATNLDFIHFFTNSLEDLQNTLPVLMLQIKKSGIIWVSWYKKSAKKPTEISENTIRDYALSIGLVDVKVCSIDDDWSGLKLVYRLKDR